MARSGPIVFVEDDIDDQEFVKEVVDRLQLPNQLIFFYNGYDAYDYLKKGDVQPMIIFSDLNLPRMTGLEFKKKIDDDPELRARSIPFVFFSTSVDRTAVDIAFKQMTVQGFFKKSTGIVELEHTINTILQYWRMSHHPNNM